jgi:hypothetical protein
MTKPARADYIRFQGTHKPELTAEAVYAIQCALDAADEGRTVLLDGKCSETSTLAEDRQAWMVAAFLIADLCEIDSFTLADLRHSIMKVTQDVLFG